MVRIVDTKRECWYSYHGVNHCSWMNELCTIHTWNDNVGDSLLHLNAAVNPETIHMALSDTVFHLL